MVLVEIFEKRRKQGIPLFEDEHHLRFFNRSGSYSRVRCFSHAQLHFNSWNPQTKSCQV